MNPKILNLLDGLFKPFFRSVDIFPLNVKCINFPISLQLATRYCNRFGKYHNETQKIDLEVADYNRKMFVMGNRGRLDMSIIVGKILEPNITKIFLAKFKDIDLFIDAGANVGYYTIFARKISLDTKILSFEPVEKTFSELKKNIDLNGITDIQIIQAGLGNENTESEMSVSNVLGKSSLVAKQKTGNPEKVKIIKFDDNFDFVNKNIFIKMDIEGFEYEALKGMENLIKNNSVQIVFEYSPNLYKSIKEDNISYAIEFLNYLKNLGFNFFEIDYNGKLLEIKSVENYAKDSYRFQKDIYLIKN